MTEPITPEDLASVVAAQDELIRRGWTIRLSLNSVVGGWTSLVREIEEGYDMNIYELTNDLSVRRYADLLIELASPAVGASLVERLAGPDARYLAATRPAGRSLMGNADGWWLQRVPLVLVGDLASDLTEFGFTDPD